MLFLSKSMEKKPIHIVSFDNPFPSNYGGVIDVFYKIKSLHALGYEIYLHCFYAERSVVSEELKAITKTVFLYKKNRNPLFFFSSIPFSVISRYSKKLIQNINLVDAPVLFEGLQSTMLMNKSDLTNKKCYLRLHNVESHFYSGMCKSERNFFRKVLYYLESKKYTTYQHRIISKFDHVFVLSKYEYGIVKSLTPKVSYIPVFHGNKIFADLSEYGKYAFYHGDLRLPDNKKAVNFLVQLFQKVDDYKLLIASTNGKDFVESQIKNQSNVAFVAVESEEQLNLLLADAHINVLLSFQRSGTKLKLVNSLFKSRFCLINRNMVDDEKVLDICEIATNETEFLAKINQLKKQPFLQNAERKKVLSDVFDDESNAQKMSSFLV